LQAHLEKEGLDAFLVSQQQNRFYLTGWSGDSESGFVLITPEKSLILTDSRYTEHAINQTDGFEVFEYGSSLAGFFADLTKKLGVKRVGYESHDLSVFSFKRLKRFCKHLKLIPVAHLIESLREVKDPDEIEKVKKAVKIADRAFDHILNFIKPGMTETHVAWEAEKFMRGVGAEKNAWEPFIVASGANSSMAHWGATNKKIGKNDMVLLDYGCVFEGYHSDTSRVIFIGKPSSEQRQIYDWVLEAQALGENLVKSGKIGSTIDKKIRRFLEKKTKYFYRHSLGHGVGLEVHELPTLGINSKNKLQASNTLTVEPGIYISKWGGVRLEDIVVVTKNGCEVLTKAPKNIKDVTI
jgi:Xaa-Pro aminopeptidase